MNEGCSRRQFGTLSLIYRALFSPKKLSITDGIIFSLGNWWQSPSELANSALIRDNSSISVSLCQCYTSIKVIKWHPLLAGNTKQSFIPNKKCKPLLTQLGNGLFLLLSLLEKKSATIFYLVGYIGISLSIFYLQLSSFNTVLCQLIEQLQLLWSAFCPGGDAENQSQQAQKSRMSHSADFPHYNILSRVYVGPANRIIVLCIHLHGSNLQYKYK